MRPLRIAHISDLHLSPSHRRVNIRHTKKLLDYIARQSVDHVVVTGDISADAKVADFALARQLFASYGLLDSSRLTVVIGNHDIFGGVHQPEDLLSFPQRCKKAEYETTQSQFLFHLREAFEGCTYPRHDMLFPFGKTVGNTLLVGLNSVARYSRMRNPFGSNGEVSEQQMNAAARLLSSPSSLKMTRIVLVHHHFSKWEEIHGAVGRSMWGAVEWQTMKLRGKRSILGKFASLGVDMILHGHTHVTHKYERRGIPCISSGGSVFPGKNAYLQFNIIEIQGSTCSVMTHRLSPDSNLTLRSEKKPLFLPQYAHGNAVLRRTA